MAVSEESRHHLYQRLEELLGPEEATTLMEHLPPVGWADVATKRDMDALGAATKRDIDELRTATRHDLDELRAATKHDLDELRTATNHGFAMLRSDLISHLERELRGQTWRMVTAGIAIASLVVAAPHL